MKLVYTWFGNRRSEDEMEQKMQQVRDIRGSKNERGFQTLRGRRVYFTTMNFQDIKKRGKW